MKVATRESTTPTSQEKRERVARHLPGETT
jgi:hypothetical protein